MSLIEDYGDSPSIEERSPDVTDEELAEINASFDEYDRVAVTIPLAVPLSDEDLKAWDDFLRTFGGE